MNRRAFNTVIAITLSLILATGNLAGLHYIDKSIGPGNVQVIRTALDINAQKFTQWSFGLIPNIKTVPESEAAEQRMRVWARPGDYAGAEFLGITFGLSAIMWFTWINFLGFPGNMLLVRQRLLALLAAAILTISANLMFARMTTEFSSFNNILSTAFGYFSLGLNAGGIWFIHLLGRLGIGQLESRPSIPPNHTKDEKLSALLMSLVIAFIIGSIFRRVNLTLPNLPFDYVIWAITTIVFFNYYGYLPSKWIKGERPFGIVISIGATVITVFVWVGVQYFTGGSIGAGLFTDAGSPGLSLMLSFWLLFWLIVTNFMGKTSPLRTRAR